MKWTIEELQEFITKLRERLTKHDVHSQEYVDGLVDEIQSELEDSNK